MFILLKDETMLNLFWLQDCYQDKHDRKIVVYLMINGTRIKEEYDTEVEAGDEVDKVKFAMDEASAGDTKPLIVDTLPTENISRRRSYLVKVSGDKDDEYQEWKYIEQEDGTMKWEMLGIQKDYSYSKQDIDSMHKDINAKITQLNEDISWKEY